MDATIAGTFGRVMAWADKYRTLKVRTNADTPADAKKARELGAEGIGLCRTEHMFFEEDRIAAFREMICADTVEEREAALEKILPYQQGDFEALYEALEGNPVTIRFLDPPLHEFVPTEEADIEKLAAAQGKSVEYIKNLIASLHEARLLPSLMEEYFSKGSSVLLPPAEKLCIGGSADSRFCGEIGRAHV